MEMNLKPQDVLVVLKLVTRGSMAYGTLANELGMSPSEVHKAVKRAADAGLLDISDPQTRQVRSRALYGFLVHGAPTAFPVKPGPITRGMPTAHAAPPLSSIIAARDDLPPVWPDPESSTRGYELLPLYKAAPGAAKRDPLLYECLALVDALRAGRARGREAAATELRRRILGIPAMAMHASPFGITENDLNAWSDTYTGSESILPDLVRRLVLFLTPRDSLIEARFPAHKAVSQSGFDGTLKTRRPTMFANTEAAVWEISTERRPKIKAERDYALRTHNPLGWDKSGTTYIALTSRIWPAQAKAQWLQQKREEGGWADVRAYDATDIAQWLALAPAVRTWFGSAIGRPVQGLDTVKEHFARWAARTGPGLGPAVPLAGRDEERGAIRQWLRGQPKRFAVAADTTEECIVFLCAAILSGGEAEKEDWLARAVVARSEDAWERLLKTLAGQQDASPLILVPAFAGFDGAVHGAEQHYVFIPRERGRGRGKDAARIELGPIDRESLAAALRGSLPNADEARKFAYECGGKLSSLQHLMGYEPPAPPWVEHEDPDILAALLLAGAWRPENTDDRGVLVRLAGGVAYAEIEKLATRLTTVPDPPLRRQGQAMKWRSNADAWQRLIGRLTPSAISRFRDVCIDILGRASPRYDLPPEERFYASVRNAVLPESDALRQGLAESLAYLATHVERVGPALRESEVVGQVDAVVRAILQGDWKHWATLNQQLPAIAEAAPEQFLSAVQGAIGDPSRALGRLFQQDSPDSALFGECCHSGLLWALEGLAWHRDHFSRVAQVLAGLAGLDRGGRHLNRPEASLSSLFHPLVKQTACTNEHRLRVLRALAERDHPAAWRVVSHVLGACSRGAPVDANQRPVFRDWTLPEPFEQYSRQEIAGFVNAVRELARDLAADAPERLLDLLRHGGADVMIDDVFALIRQQASELRKEENRETARKLQGFLRKWVAQKGLSQKSVAASSDQVETAKELIRALDPEDSVARAIWLFEYNVTLPDSSEWDGDWQKKEQRVDEMRRSAVADLLGAGSGVPRVLELVGLGAEPALVGRSLAELPGAEGYDQEVVRGPLAQEGPEKEFALSFIARRVQDAGVPWLTDLAGRLLAGGSPELAADALATVRSVPEIRDWVDLRADDFQDDYWRQASMSQPTVRDDDDFARIVANLLAAHRWDEAMEFAFWTLHDDSHPGRAADYIRILEHPLVDGTAEELKRGLGNHSAPFVISRIFRHLDSCAEVSSETLADLEVLYLEKLEDSERPARHVMDQLEQSPEFFAGLVSAVFRPDSAGDKGEAPPSDIRAEQREADKGWARMAYGLLCAWDKYPGVNQPADKRDAALRQWCDKALELVRESGRDVAGQHQIAQVLCRVPPPKEDGVWPCRVARDYIESGRREIAEGLEVARFNSRGAVVKSLGEGGKQERETAAAFQSDADRVRDAYPATAAMLERISQSYLRWAEHEDVEAEQFTDP